MNQLTNSALCVHCQYLVERGDSDSIDNTHNQPEEVVEHGDRAGNHPCDDPEHRDDEQPHERRIPRARAQVLRVAEQTHVYVFLGFLSAEENKGERDNSLRRRAR